MKGGQFQWLVLELSSLIKTRHASFCEEPSGHATKTHYVVLPSALRVLRNMEGAAQRIRMSPSGPPHTKTTLDRIAEKMKTSESTR